MSIQANGPFNAAIRQAGNRSRALPDAPMPSMAPPAIPNIGQNPTPSMAPPAPQSGPPPAAAPPIQPSTFTMHPPGTPADTHQYNYEPQPDGSWRVYPPGVNAPPHTYQASLPRAASTGDFMRMSQAFAQTLRSQQPPQPPMPPAGGQQVQGY